MPWSLLTLLANAKPCVKSVVVQPMSIGETSSNAAAAMMSIEHQGKCVHRARQKAKQWPSVPQSSACDVEVWGYALLSISGA